MQNDSLKEVPPLSDAFLNAGDPESESELLEEQIKNYGQQSRRFLLQEIFIVWMVAIGFISAYAACYLFKISYGSFLHGKILYAVFVAFNIFAAGQAFYSWAVLSSKSVARDYMFFLTISFIGAAMGNSIDYVIWVSELSEFKQSIFTNLIFIFSMLLAFPGIHFLGQVCQVKISRQPLFYYAVFIFTYALIPTLMNLDILKGIVNAGDLQSLIAIDNLKEFLFGILYSMVGAYLASISLYVWQTGKGRLVSSARLIALGMVAMSIGCAIYAGLFPRIPPVEIASNPVNLIIAMGYILTALGVRRTRFTVQTLMAFKENRLPPAVTLMEIFGESDGMSVYKNLEMNIKSTVLQLMKSREETQQKQEEIGSLEHEITQRKLIEQELLLAKTRAEELNDAKSQFLAMMSHELKTPLTAIKGYSAILRGNTLQSLLAADKISEISLQIESSADYLAEMVNSLLEFSQLESKTFNYHPEKFALKEIMPYIRSIALTHQKIAGCEYDETVTDPETIIESDRQAVQQIISNLLVNAFKFCNGSRVSLSITHTVTELAIRVKDGGIGISQSDQERIFEAFCQLSTGKKRKYGGIGLGLSIVKKHVAELKGSISVLSSPNQGAEFTVKLPVCLSEIHH